MIIIYFAIFWIISTKADSDCNLEVETFANKSSERYYKLYNQIAENTYASLDDEDFEDTFKKLQTVQTISRELVEISTAAAEFDLTEIHDEVLKRAIKKLRQVGDLFVLGDEYFSSVLINLASLHELSIDKDIPKYTDGINRSKDQDNDLISYYPDIQHIFENSNDTRELKYYWEIWREKNLFWSSVNFQTIVDAFEKAANILKMSPLGFWYRFYENENFVLEMEQVMHEIKPAYQQLHAFVRYELYKKYGSDIIDLNGPIPDHLFEQVLAQPWKENSIIESYFPFTQLPPYDTFVKDYDAKKAIDEAERFYKSLGFSQLDEEFFSDRLKEHDERTNSGDCRADIFDLTPKVFMKYCQKVDFRKFMQNHGYLSRLHYAAEKKHLPSYFFQSYDLEYALGEAVILSASTPKHLTAFGLAENFKFTENTLMNRLFRMGIHTLLNVPLYFVHSKLMNDLFNGTIQMDGINKHYWKLMQEYAGIEPPSDRKEDAIDFPYTFYLDLEQNYQTKKFVSEILGYQFYRAFCTENLEKGELHNCDFYKNLAVGEKLKKMMSLGSTKSWRDVITVILPDKPALHGDALLDYYSPIVNWVKTVNTEKNVKIGWNATKKKIL